MVGIKESLKNYYAGPKSDHFDGQYFFNDWGQRAHKSMWDVLKWRLQGGRSVWPAWVQNPPRPAPEETSDALKVTYIGHATFLVQAGGVNLLVDPVFSNRASPFTKMGPKRVRAPFVPLEKLPKIDFVFVSHNHYDHMDLASLSWLATHHKPTLITPLGNARIMKPWVQDCGIISLDWHQQTDLGAMSLYLTPSQHWSRRGYNDINRDLWGGFFLKTAKGESLYYCGDSGFFAELFDNIRTRHGAPDIALLPIGAYEPRWFMQYAHMNPEDAINAYHILGAHKGMGYHFETFQLTDEAFDAPRTAMENLLYKHDIKGQDFIIPYPGNHIMA